MIAWLRRLLKMPHAPSTNNVFEQTRREHQRVLNRADGLVKIVEDYRKQDQVLRIKPR